MKTTLLRSVAASALLVGASLAVPAASYAQTTDQSTGGSATTQAPADGTMKNDSTMKNDAGGSAMKSGSDAAAPAAGDASGTDTTTAPASGDAAAPATSGDAATTTDSSGSAGTDDKVVTEQKESQVLASTYIGQSVYNSNDKSIGDISDLVFDQNGGIQAAVIGVGGFLGIGQKDVAVKFDRIKIQRKPDSADVKLVTDMTSDQLKQSPEFKNLQTKMNEQNSAKPATNDASGTMGTTTGGASGTGAQ